MGVARVVVCPGSRNAPLVFALQNYFKTYTHLDERGAAFFALGMMQSRPHEPVAVLCTSGTAAVELFPAIVEAHYQGVSLIAITADRPLNYRKSGAPQAINQEKLFGEYAEFYDVLDVENYPNAVKKNIPLHLNIPLEEPRAGDWPQAKESLDQFKIEIKNEAPLTLETLDSSAFSTFLKAAVKPLVLVSGVSDSNSIVVNSFLAKLQWPVLSESTAYLPDIKNLKFSERFFKENPPTHILRIGAVPSFRIWRDLENAEKIQVFSLNNVDYSGLARNSLSAPLSLLEKYLEIASSHPADEYLQKATAYSEERERHFYYLLTKYPRSEHALLHDVANIRDPKSALFLGNSLAIREWLQASSESTPSTFASRGANGIDGQISSFLGISENYAETWAVIGDQTAMYDMNALCVCKSLSQKKRRLLIINNRGGKIFSHLSYSSSLTQQQARTLENNHNYNFEPWAQFFGWAYHEHTGADVFPQELFSRDELIIELVPDATQTHNFWNKWRK